MRGLSQQDLADMIASATDNPDISKSSISRVETLETGYTQDFLEACADALGTHPGILLMRAPIAADGVVVELPRTKEKRPVQNRRPRTMAKRSRS